MRNHARALYGGGRRLGYPLKLGWRKATTSAAGMIRVASGSISRQRHEDSTLCPDAFYLTWPEPIALHEIERGWFMQNLSPREELAFFLGQRGNCSAS